MRSIFALASLLLAVVTASGATKPNIVFFIADDYSWHDSGAYGSKDARTPNIDALAKESMKFELAFAASPTCTPSRSALLTGDYPVRNGAHANHSTVNDGLKTLPAYLRERGYRVVIAGKTHFGPRSAFAFEYLDNSNVMPAGKNHILWTDLNTSAVEKLLAEHDKATPLCLIVASHSPHVFWLPNDGFEPANISLPPYLVDTKETRRAMCKYLTDVAHMDAQLGDVRRSLAKHGYTENTVFGFTSDQGAQFPFAKWNVYDAGIRVPLIVHWPGVTQAGTTTRAMVSLIDLLPTFVEIAGGEAPKEIDGRSFIGVLRGESDVARQAVFAAHTGDAQMNRSPQRCIRTAKYKLIVNLKPDDLYKTHISAAAGADGKDYWDSWVALSGTDPHAKEMVDRYQHRPPEELYDVEADPYELKNLIDDPVYAQVAGELRGKLNAWRIQQGEDLSKVLMPEDGRKGDVPYAK